MKKKSFAPLTNNFWSFKKKGLKNIYQWSKTCIFFFHQKSEGIDFIFCRYSNQNMRAFIFCRYCPPIVFFPQIWKTKKSSKIEGNTLGILRRSFFPFNALGMPSFNNSIHCNPIQGNYRAELLHREISIVITGNEFTEYSFLLFWLHFFPCLINVEIVALFPVMCTGNCQCILHGLRGCFNTL